MIFVRRLSWLIFFSSLLQTSAGFAADKAGSSDYPGIGRFEGSEIEFYSTENYGETTLATGPVLKDSDAKTTAMTVEGRITRIVYKVPKGSSALEVFRNFENRITEAGYRTIFSGGPKQFNDYKFKYKHPVEKLQSISLSSKIWYLSAKKTAGGSDTYISILASPHSGGDGQRVRLIAVETKTMENRMVDAAKMQASINETGKVALYGIYFDTGSAAVKKSSAPTLQEIAKLLRGSSSMKIIVVGHTDNQGGYDYNIDLSKRRAAAVAQALQTAYKISPSRLRSAGVGYLAPAANNTNEEGRTLNRRVELVRDK